jgi:hypothetical protein
MTSPWPIGTDSGKAARTALRVFIKEWLANEKYKARLPRQHLKVLDEGEREGAGVTIRILSEPDQKPAWTYVLGGHDIAEDYHAVALVVKADKKAGGSDSVSAVFGALRALFANRDGTPERLDLQSAGIHMCFETPEGIELDGDSDEEGTFFKQQISLRCNTDTFLN